jgi:hypothetical protein
VWDHSKLSKFKFTWWDVTTFRPYTEETSFENSIMTQRSGALQLSSLKSVYQSLTTNAKGIFSVIINYQLENQKLAHYQGNVCSTELHNKLFIFNDSSFEACPVLLLYWFFLYFYY